MKAGIRKFFAYARERQSIHLKKMSGVPRPWTKDPILDHHRFCNVFRENDRTTKWFREHVRHPMRNTAEVLLATVVFRLFNRISTGEAVFCQKDVEYENAFAQYVATGKTSALRRAIKANCAPGPYVTGSYTIVGKPGLPKLDGMLWVIDNFRKKSDWESKAQSLLNDKSPRLQDVWEWMREFEFFGDFHSYEIVTDLRHTALLNNATDIMTWANPGPGANRGANRVFGRDKDQRNSKERLNEEMREILGYSLDRDLWPGAGKHITTLRGRPAYSHEDWPAWEMRDVEHTLCEFDKYMRVMAGEGRPRGVYR